MILWTIKQLFSLKKALTGRANPSELAWGLALGIAIGLIPKGNLVSVAMIGLLVTLRVNHGMAALSAVAVSFLAFRFDPWTHQLGSEVLQSPKTRDLLQRFWDAPFVPWTDLNNTVVMGSTIVGLGSVLPTFLLTLPIFRWLAPKKKAEKEQDPPPAVALAMNAVATTTSATSDKFIPALPPASVAPPQQPELHVVRAESVDSLTAPDDSHSSNSSVAETSDEAIRPAETTAVGSQATEIIAKPTSVQHTETQIEIIRMKPLDKQASAEDGNDQDSNGPMNEALGYLLRRLRDSRQEKAA